MSDRVGVHPRRPARTDPQTLSKRHPRQPPKTAQGDAQQPEVTVPKTDAPPATECPACGGSGTFERFIVGLGMTEALCEADGCEDGLVR